MKCKFVLLVFFGVLAIGHNKPMSSIHPRPRSHQKFWYFDSTNGDMTTITGDVNEFCQRLAADENSKRTVPVLYGFNYRNEFFYTCEVDDNASTTQVDVGDYDTTTQGQTETIIISDTTTDTSKLSELFPSMKPETSGQMENTNKEAVSTTAATTNSEGLDELIYTTTDRDIGNNAEINEMVTENLSTNEKFNEVVDHLEQLEESKQKIHEATTATADTVSPTGINQVCTTTDRDIGNNAEINEMVTENLSTNEKFNEVVDHLEQLEESKQKIHEVTTATADIVSTTGINQEASWAPYKNILKGYEFHSSVDGWMKLHVMPASWEDARLRCLREGSTLASPVSLPMLNAMKEVLEQKVSIVYTGISENYAPGLFYSVEGVALDNIPASFVPGQPAFQHGVEQCVSMFTNGTITLSRCDTLSSFICYVKDSDVPEIQSPCGQDPDYTFDSRTGQCYKFHTVGRTWSSAFMTCATEGGHLAIINSEVEAQVLVELVNKHADSKIRSDYPTITLLGFRDWSEHNTWMTIHGQTLAKAGYSAWGQGEPNDARSEFCGAMFRSGELNDTLCGSPMPFVCEKKPNVPLS